jgi:hypothetical protein
MVTWRIFALAAAFLAGFAFAHFVSRESSYASHANRYAYVRESTSSGSIRGAEGIIWTGAPSPVPSGTFSNQTIWAVENDACGGGQSWVEVGWTKKGTDPIKYKFIYKVPGSGSCTYTEHLAFGSPADSSFHEYRVEYCNTCGANHYWYFYLDDIWTDGIKTDWQNVNRIQAGGEVGGHYTGIGMQGGINDLRYRLGSSSWYSLNPDYEECTYGYWLIYNGGSVDDIYDWGYSAPGGCP